MTENRNNIFDLFVKVRSFHVEHEKELIAKKTNKVLYPVEFYWMTKDGENHKRVVWFEEIEEAERYVLQEEPLLLEMMRRGTISDKAICKIDSVLYYMKSLAEEQHN